MIACLITYEIDAYRVDAFEAYARTWNEAIPRCGGRLIGYFAPYEGSATTAIALIAFDSLAAYEQYRAALKADPQGRENLEFAGRERFITREDRLWLRRV